MPTKHNLDSWKRIAKYLGKTVRTVQRWERVEGLPVHRHQHKKRGTVYASTEEIDAWLAARSVASARGKGNHRYLMFVAVLAIVVIGVLVSNGLIVDKNNGAPKKVVLSFAERPWVLLVPLQNQTGDPRLTDSLDYAIYQGLVATHQVNIVSTERVQDTLRLMRMDPDQPLDLKLALDVTHRDTQVRTVIAGRVQRVGTEYTLGLESIDTATGLATEVVAGETTRPEELLHLARGLVSRLIDDVGTEPWTERELETVTTKSLRAAQLYTQANRMLLRQSLGGEDMNAAAEELLREAVKEDPDFASAHLLLSWSIFRQQKQKADFMPHADRALTLIDSASEVERFFIRGSHFSLAGDMENSIPIYQALIDRYPDHFWANNNLLNAYLSTRRLAPAADALVKSTELRPTSLRLNYRAAYYLYLFGDSRATLIADRVQELAGASELKDQWEYEIFWIKSRLALSAWLAADMPEFRLELDHLDGITNEMIDKQAKQMATVDLAFMEFSSGHNKAGWDRLNTLNDNFDFRNEALVRAAYTVGDTNALGDYLTKAISTVEAHRYAYTLVPLLLVRAGRVAEAEGLLERLTLAPEMAAFLQGALALAMGDYQEGVSIIENAHKIMLFSGDGYYLSCEMLAEAFVIMNMPQRARDILETASNRQAQSAAVGSMPAWIRNQQLLARLLRETGEIVQAEKIESGLSTLLALADEDHPVKVWLAQVNTKSN